MRRLGVLAVIAGLLYIPGANAGHESGTTPSYTGCLATRGTTKGKISKVKRGDQPLRPCTGSQQVIHLSGGDITQVNAGTGLGGGGSTGLVTLDLASSYRLPQSCSSDEIARWDGNSWECSDDQTAAAPTVAFRAIGNFGQIEMTQGTHVVEMPTEAFDTADGYDPVASSFTVPAGGVYDFDARNIISSPSASSDFYPNFASISLRVDGTVACSSVPVPKAETNEEGVFFLEFPCLLQLDVGDVIDLVVNLSGGPDVLDVQFSAILSGSRV